MIKHHQKLHYAHRLAFELMGINIPEGVQVDHINGVRHDNRWENLRLVSCRGNSSNRVEHRRGNLLGASYYKKYGNWRAQIVINKKKKHLGYFDTEQEAHQAYLTALKELSSTVQ